MKIGLINGGGYRNWGDDAQIKNVVLKLKENNYDDLMYFSRAGYMKDLLEIPTCPSSHNLFKECKNDEDALMMFNYIVEYVDNPKKLPMSAKRFVKNIKSIDVLFFAGSGTINTRHLKGLCVFLLPIVLAKKLGKRIILSAQGIGPMNNEEYFDFISDALKDIKLITVRDFGSGIKELRKVNTECDIATVPDDAFDFPISTNRFDYLKDQKVCGINVSSSITEPLTKTLYQIATELKGVGYTVIFNYFQKEETIAKECARDIFEIVHFDSPSEIAEFYSHCDLAIGMRYHSTIFSLSQKVPHINIYLNEYQKTKINAIEDEFDIKFGVNGNEDIDLYEEVTKVLSYDKSVWEKIYNNLNLYKHFTVGLINDNTRID